MRVGLPERLLRAVPDAEQAFRAPGRANLIGEHTDYNQGFVLPAALELATYVAGRPRDDGVVSLRSLDGPDFEPFVSAVVSALRDDGVDVIGFEGAIASEVPIGAGLSSSAALEVALACALGGASLEPTRLAAACHRAENVYLGTQSGIMDQLTSAAGRAGHALLIDCRDVTVHRSRSRSRARFRYSWSTRAFAETSPQPLTTSASRSAEPRRRRSASGPCARRRASR